MAKIESHKPGSDVHKLFDHYFQDQPSKSGSTEVYNEFAERYNESPVATVFTWPNRRHSGQVANILVNLADPPRGLRDCLAPEGSGRQPNPEGKAQGSGEKGQRE